MRHLERPPQAHGLLACLLGLALFWGGCAHVPSPSPSKHLGVEGPAGRCAEFFADLDQAIKQAGVRDAGAFRIRGHPYLRTNRFLASFRDEIKDEAMFSAWLDRLQELDREARRHEIDNLPSLERLDPPLEANRTALVRRVRECGDVLREADCRGKRAEKRIQRRARAADEYIVLRRVAGAYPLTRFLVLRGVKGWHEEAETMYSAEPPPKKRTRYALRSPSNSTSTPSDLVERVYRDALGIPDYSARAKKALFRYYAPVWEVKTRSRGDHIGTPAPENRSELRVATKRPITFTRLSFTRFGDSVLTQLNYVVWIPARPKTGSLDLRGGFLDGLNYRVTLDTDGKPLLYETMHNCGCYHRLFPTNRLTLRGNPKYAEPPLVLPSPEVSHDAMRVVISLASRTHYVEHLYGVPRDRAVRGERYSLAPYRRLRSLPLPNGGSRSLFRENALVAGSERLERLFLWPTGVLSPGAMRQWGRHAVAFVGKRHFDDPRLIGRIFRRAERPQ
ncbi:MAG: hypothetical protein V5B78_05185 [Desulfohalobiaceae bacterium]